MRIAFLLVRHPTGRVSPIIPETMRLLAEGGATVDVLHPDEAQDVQSLRHDLYVLKARTETALGVAAALHARGAAILNPYPVTALCRDKFATTQVLAAAGVPVPDTWVAADPRQLIPLLDDGALVVKPRRGSQGRGVQVVRARADVGRLATDEPLMAQRYLEPDGPDYKIYRIGDACFCVHRSWPPATYTDKLGVLTEIDEHLRQLTYRCGSALGIDLYGVDVIMTAGQPYVVDFSSFPGFKGVPDAARGLSTYIRDYATTRVAAE